MPFSRDTIRKAVDGMFVRFDKENSGYIQGKQLQVMYTQLRKELLAKKAITPEEIQRIVNETDISQDKRVSKDEMFLLLRKLNP